MNSSKENWIFLRGLSREQEHWGSFSDLFRKKISPNVYCIDFPGTGIFHKDAAPASISEIAGHLIETSGRITSQSWILAHSMGCLVAMEWMRREPHRFHGAVFINTSVRGMSPLFKRLRISGLWTFVKIVLTQDSKKKEELKFFLSSNNVNQKNEIISKWMDIQKQRPVSLLTTWKQLLAAALYVPIKPRYPILLLNSLGDRLVNPDCSKEISKQWNFPIQTHPTAGHEITLDDPGWVIEKIQEWAK